MPSDFQQHKPKIVREEWLFQIQDIQYLHILRMLFTHPKLAYALLGARRPWLGAFLTFLLFFIGGALLLTLDEAPSYGTDIRQATQFVLDTVGDTTFTPEQIDWSTDSAAAVQASTALPHAHLDIVEHWDSFQPRPAGGTSKHGIVLCREGIGYWQSFDDTKGAVRELILPAQRLALLGKSMPGLSTGTQAQVCRVAFTLLCGALYGMNLLELLQTVLLPAILMTFVWIVGRRAWHLSAFPHYLMLSMSSLLPPALIALFWKFFGVPGEYSTHFFLLFVIYFIYAFFEGKDGKLIRKGEEEEK